MKKRSKIIFCIYLSILVHCINAYGQELYDITKLCKADTIFQKGYMLVYKEEVRIVDKLFFEKNRNRLGKKTVVRQFLKQGKPFIAPYFAHYLTKKYTLKDFDCVNYKNTIGELVFESIGKINYTLIERYLIRFTYLNKKGCKKEFYTLVFCT
jgi:hypothetical protein